MAPTADALYVLSRAQDAVRCYHLRPLDHFIFLRFITYSTTNLRPTRRQGYPTLKWNRCSYRRSRRNTGAPNNKIRAALPIPRHTSQMNDVLT